MYLLFDIGGTNTRLGYSKNGEDLGNVEKVKTPENIEDLIDIFKDYVKKISKSSPKIIAGGCPGTINEDKKIIEMYRNFPNWEKKPIGQLLNNSFGSQVYLKNDADLAGLGEAVYGAGRGFPIVAYITISTGVGGVRIVDERIDTAVYGMEPGYQIIDVDGSVDVKFLAAGNRYNNHYGYLQRLVSGKDLMDRFGKPAENIEETAVWEEITKYLSAGLINTIVHWSPNVVVLGGGIMKSPYLSLEKIAKYLEEMNEVFPKLPGIKKAELGDKAGLYGALAYIKKLQLNKEAV